MLCSPCVSSLKYVKLNFGIIDDSEQIFIFTAMWCVLVELLLSRAGARSGGVLGGNYA